MFMKRLMPSDGFPVMSVMSWMLNHVSAEPASEIAMPLAPLLAKWPPVIEIADLALELAVLSPAPPKKPSEKLLLKVLFEMLVVM